MVRIFLILLVLLFIAGSGVNGQENNARELAFNQLYTAAETEYGIHQELVHGFLYEDKNPGVLGHPFLLDYYSNQGSVVYRGTYYANLSLRYDIHDQQLILIYPFDGVEYTLLLEKAFVNQFTIENKKFKKGAFGSEDDERYYQVIGDDSPAKMLLYWKKGIANVNVNNPDIKRYTLNPKETYLLFENERVGFSGNRSLIRAFASHKKAAVRDYIRRNKMRIKQVTDSELEQLIAFINTLED